MMVSGCLLRSTRAKGRQLTGDTEGLEQNFGKRTDKLDDTKSPLVIRSVVNEPLGLKRKDWRARRFHHDFNEYHDSTDGRTALLMASASCVAEQVLTSGLDINVYHRLRSRSRLPICLFCDARYRYVVQCSLLDDQVDPKTVYAGRYLSSRSTCATPVDTFHSSRKWSYSSKMHQYQRLSSLSMPLVASSRVYCTHAWRTVVEGMPVNRSDPGYLVIRR
jgi:hypothetical protein